MKPDNEPESFVSTYCDDTVYFVADGRAFSMTSEMRDGKLITVITELTENYRLRMETGIDRFPFYGSE